MSSKRDLVEAHSFNRRRLVTAFVSGAPGGREVEPVRYGRTLVGGLVLAVLLVAGAAAAGFLKPTVPEDWKEHSLVIGKTSGSRFVAVDGKLFPVINTTSARLVLEAEGSLDPTFVPDDVIAEQVPGPAIGIPGAPDVLPEQDRLVQTGWTACTDVEGQTKVRVDRQPAALPTRNGALVVEANGKLYVVSGQHRYEVPKKHRDAVLLTLELDGQTPLPVSGLWLDLFPPGDPLKPFDVDGAGETAASAPAGAEQVGTPVLVDGRPYLVMRDGLAPVSDFAYDIYVAGLSNGLEPVSVDQSDVIDVPKSTSLTYPESWPEEEVAPVAQACAVLETGDAAPVVHLARPVDDQEAFYDPDLRQTAAVEGGHGALVRSSSGGQLDTGAVYLVDATGTRYSVEDPQRAEQTLAYLGYTDVEPVPVPAAWLELFDEGPALVQQNAKYAASGS